MKIAFVVPQSGRGSTMIGRVLPLAAGLAHDHRVTVLHLGEAPPIENVALRRIGWEPFKRTAQGKQRLGGPRLVLSMLVCALMTGWQLSIINPDTVVIVKTLPHTVLGVRLWRVWNRRKQCILDVDDFELLANKLSSLTQRAAVHWAERAGSKMSQVIVVATPFLADHFLQLTGRKKKVVLIPTGVSLPVSGSETKPQQPVITYLGSLSHSSGHRVDLLPEIFRLVRDQRPDTRLLIAGDGDDRASLEHDLTALGLANQTEWVGRFLPGEVPDLLARTSIVIDPIDSSVTQRAKSSYRVAVAAAAGKPVVTSNVGVRPYFLPLTLHDKFFAEPAQVAAYAEKIVALLDNPLSTQESQLLRKHSARYTWDSLCQQYSKLLSAS